MPGLVRTLLTLLSPKPAAPELGGSSAAPVEYRGRARGSLRRPRLVALAQTAHHARPPAVARCGLAAVACPRPAAAAIVARHALPRWRAGIEAQRLRCTVAAHRALAGCEQGHADRLRARRDDAALLAAAIELAMEMA